MNAKQKLHQANLKKWAKLCTAQAESGLTIKEWCAKHHYSVYAYHYWKHKLKEVYVDSMMPDIVPLSPQDLAIPNTTSTCVESGESLESYNSPDSRNSIPTFSLPCHPVTVSIGDTHIEIGASASDEMIVNIIRAVRYA